MAKKVFVVITIILLFLGGTFYFFPCSAKVESVRVFNLNKDNEALLYELLKEAKCNFKPEKKYLYLAYTVSIQPHLPLRFHFENITFQQLRDDFKVILLEPGIPHQEGGLFKEKHEYFNVLVECPNDMNPEVIINNTNFELHAYRLVINQEWKKHPEHTTYYLSYPSWPDVKVKVTKDMIIEIEH